MQPILVATQFNRCLRVGPVILQVYFCIIPYDLWYGTGTFLLVEAKDLFYIVYR